MASVLEELYNGNIRPDVKRYGEFSPFADAVQLKSRNLDELMATLNEPEKKLFEKYCDAQSEIEAITRYDTFTYALKFGVLFMVEILAGKADITGMED